MKKKLLWVGIAFLVLLVLMVGLATVGLQDALNLKITSVDLVKIPDGTYTGKYVSGRWSTSVQVTVQDHVITAINPQETAKGQESLTQTLSQRVMDAQSPDVDVIAGATASSKSFLKAVETALENVGAP